MTERRHTVLVVEDDDDVRDLVGEVLTDAGYGVLLARHGREGLDHLAKSHVDVVLLDLFMPVMNGWDFFAALRADSAKRRIPVVVISSAADQAPGGAERVLPKPIAPRALLAVVRQLASETAV